VSPPARQARAGMIERLGPWFHNLHLPDGTQTAPDHRLGDFPRYKWEVLRPHLPERLDGWTALDLGCNAGFYSFELARRGARVTAIDLDEHYLHQARWAAREYGLEHAIDFRRMQVYDLSRMEEQFDLVLFMGLFYHLRYPLLGLDLVAARTRRLMIFQTLTTPGVEVEPEIPDQPLDSREALTRPGWPRMAFIEHRFAGDPTNWWVPNHACVLAMLRSCGFSVAANLGHEIYLCHPDRHGQAAAGAPWRVAELLAATGRGWREAADQA
jgi:tRNA (mo5U34)-methyltransferase